MSNVLDYGTKSSHSGDVTSMVVFLHGYGADGKDLLGLGDPLAEHLPNTVFVAPDAPERSAMNPAGFQWFPVPWIDGSTEAASAEGLDRSATDLNAFLDHVMADYDLEARQVALVGFSQGTMMALQVAPRRPEEFACVVGFSGRLLNPEALEEEVLVRPPVLLLHGDADDVVPPELDATRRRRAGGRWLAGNLRTCDERHRSRHRTGRIVSGIGVSARQATGINHAALSRTSSGSASKDPYMRCLRFYLPL